MKIASSSSVIQRFKVLLLLSVGNVHWSLKSIMSGGGSSSSTIMVSAQSVPSNDVCSTASPITIGSILAGDLTFAISDEDQVLNGDGCSGTTVYADYPGLWYTFQGTGGRVWPTTCFSESAATSISVYTGSCGSTNLQCVAGVESDCGNNEKFAFDTNANMTYYVLVRSYSTPGPFQLAINSVVAPPNDICSNATSITFGSIIAGNLTLATSDVEQVLNGDGCSGTTVYADYPGLWYTFQGTGGRVWPTTCFPESAATSISVYTGSCGSTNLQCVAGVESDCGNNEKFAFDTNANMTYYVLVRSYSTPGPFQLAINSVVAPPNDICSTATPITFGSIIAGNLTLATSDVDQVLSGDGCSGTMVYADYPGLWYTFQGTGSRVWPTTCFSESVTTSLSVYTGSCGSTNLQCVAGVESDCGNNEKFAFDANANMTYYVLVRSYSTPGPFLLTVNSTGTSSPTIASPPAAPAPSPESSASPNAAPMATSAAPILATSAAPQPTRKKCGLLGLTVGVLVVLVIAV